MNELPARPLRYLLLRAAYDCVCAFAMVAGLTAGLLLYLEYPTLTAPSRAALAGTTLLVAAWLTARHIRRR